MVVWLSLNNDFPPVGPHLQLWRVKPGQTRQLLHFIISHFYFNFDFQN